jgi:hypothetical protein
MARPEAALGGLRQRQRHTCGDDAFVANDHGPVVQRRVRGEQRLEKLRRQLGVELDARLGRVVEARVTLEHDQGADLLSSELCCAQGNRRGHLLDRAPRAGHE